ncbi:Sugar kinase of the NBD/HSP70 family, may contain an N-terminal HTH domain [Raineyella antarctica]|uniref:Sugar kinase of the NBD/HSP70 family, may contain an N-terminal HTH domain n=1 Tax=Raineyella antarctica TaxID=1577474 RepID=A0A1G6HQ90_9ACTN|nr:ROK family transcriptional regulator [Raineyella antarctica]SDB96449.1 Sugar kinase of the NBD/HSP70 family, may contain an N-terminal HTH domain [Raineyella antarctica]
MTGTPGIRNRTRRAVYDYVREQGFATKKDIADALGMSLPTVSKYLNHFLEAGLLEPGPKQSSGSQGGRNPITYACVADGRYAVGVDVTRDRARFLLVNLDRRVLAERRTARRFENTESYYAFVAGEVEVLIEQAGIDRSRIFGVGIAVPGLISETTGKVTYGRVIDNVGLSAADFARHLPYEIRLVHDSEAAGLAEFWSKEAGDNAVYLSLSKSVGGSVLINGGMYRGDGEIAGELGHMRIHDDGLLCYCGRHGCLDPYCNAEVLSRHTDGSVGRFFQELSAGDPELAGVWDHYTSDLAIGIHNIRVMFGCTIILGGDVGSHGRDHLADLRAKVDRLNFLASDSSTFLVPSRFTRHPIAVGAALYLVADFRQNLGAALPPRTRQVEAPSASAPLDADIPLGTR